MNKEDLLKMIENDHLGLLAVKQVGATVTENDRLIESFQEINRFVAEHGREPKSGGSVQEHRYATRLQSIRKDAEKSKSLAEFDEHNLLSVVTKEITSIDDIFQNDSLGLLEGVDESLFKLKHVSSEQKRDISNYIAQAKPCKNFNAYENMFTQCQVDLSGGKRRLVQYEGEQSIDRGDFFVLRGIVLFVADKGEKIVKNGKTNYRLRCIFENGTESDLLLRSLSRELYRNGYRVSIHEDHLLDNFKSVDDTDTKTGFIYIVKSLSNDERIKSLSNLHKIGFSSVPVEERIRNASEDPTYLMAPVSIVSTFECYNFNPQKFEQLLHAFFGNSCLNLDIFNGNGRRFSPREWFIAPINVIEKAVELIINGGIVNYRYDNTIEKIVLR